MRIFSNLWRSSVGVKALMALSGGALFAWSALHAAGSLLVFAGPEVMNGYGAALQGTPLIWMMRAGLLGGTALHVACAIRIRRLSAAAGSDYRAPVARRASTLAGRSMAATGAAGLVLLIAHVAHLYGPLAPDYVAGDVHHNLSRGLASPIAAGLYAVGAGLFGLHLAHGAASALRTLGYAGPLGAWARRAAIGIGALFLLPAIAGLAGLWG